jgi:hypothetical protein
MVLSITMARSLNLELSCKMARSLNLELSCRMARSLVMALSHLVGSLADLGALPPGGSGDEQPVPPIALRYENYFFGCAVGGRP